MYAKNDYFHLYIRKCGGGNGGGDGGGKTTTYYSLGLEKPREKYFQHPADIINYYRLHKLQCTNKNISVSIVLVPIT